MFILLSIIARGGRFFLLAFLLHRYGPQARVIIEERLGFWVTIGAVVLVGGIIGGAVFVLAKGSGEVARESLQHVA